MTLGGGDLSRLDMEARGGADAVEQLGFGARHPHLAAAFEAGEERGAALRVEVRRDFVEEEDRGLLAPVGDQLRMGENEAE